MSNLNYKNPLTPISIPGTQSVPRDENYGINFSVLGIGGFMEVYTLDDLKFTIPSGTTGTVGDNAWYTWIIPTSLTNNLKQTSIDYNKDGDPQHLTTVNTESTIYDYTFTYTGTTIPTSTYRIYTTFPDGNFEINNNQSIYFKGNTVE